ncbi:MAG: GNAT family N-acetyltransferase [Chloroflexi bacterium]|nr:GNAT family N-acetyltransferase [Chloroflexota bacterium]
MVEIGLVKQAERMAELTALFRLCFNHDMPLEVWEWQYLRNPLSSTDDEVVVALDSGKIVGARPFIYAEMWLGDAKIKTAQHCDTMVHPEHRNKGIFNKMGNYALKYLGENGFYLSYGFPGPMSRRGFLSQSYRIIVETEFLFRAKNPQKLLSYKLNSELLSNGLGLLYDKFLNPKTKSASQESDIFKVEVFDRFPDELKKVDSLRDKAAINLVRSEDYLKWRFDLNPEH